MSNARKKPTRSERAARAARMRAEQQAAERRRRLWLTGGVVLLLLVVVVASVAIYRSTSSVGKGDVATPGHTTSDGGFVVPGVSAGDGTPHVVAYEDFMCPVCGQFEAESGSWLATEAAAGRLVLEYRPIAILDQASSTDYSTRATAAAACVADEAGLEAFATMHAALFAQQPAEGGAGLTDDDLVTLAVQAGADREQVSSCIDAGTYTDWVAQTTDRASDDGVSGTPTVLVDGTLLEQPTLDNLKAAVEAAR